MYNKESGKKYMKKKGFTLIELLAVIVVLTIIALIATPIVARVINSSKGSANKISASNFASKANEYVIEERMNGKKPTSGVVYANDNETLP